MKYRVKLTQTLSSYILVEAESGFDAATIVEKAYLSGELKPKIDSQDFEVMSYSYKPQDEEEYELTKLGD